jgi:hypothetical protein
MTLDLPSLDPIPADIEERVKQLLHSSEDPGHW